MDKNELFGVGETVLICSIWQFPWFVISSLIDFKIPKWSHWAKIWEEMHATSSTCSVSAPAQGWGKAGEGWQSKQYLNLNLERWVGIFWMERWAEGHLWDRKRLHALENDFLPTLVWWPLALNNWNKMTRMISKRDQASEPGLLVGVAFHSFKLLWSQFFRI